MRVKISGVYQILNITNGHKYIGSAIDIYFRWLLHIRQLHNHKHHSIYLQRAWDKYGESCFMFQSIELCNPDDLLNREQHYMDNLSPEYNILKKAGSVLGLQHSAESKMKMSLAKIGKKASPEALINMSIASKRKIITKETREKMAACLRGKPLSSETKAKLSIAQKGRICYPSTREKLSIANKGKVLSDEHRAKIAQAIKQWHKDRKKISGTPSSKYVR
jgi:group I intron endonuclease